MNNETDLILPDINPIIKDLLRKQRKEPKESQKQYRCNACCNYFPERETDLYKYKPDSNHRHRVCLKCIRHMNANIG